MESSLALGFLVVAGATWLFLGEAEVVPAVVVPAVVEEVLVAVVVVAKQTQ